MTGREGSCFETNSKKSMRMISRLMMWGLMAFALFGSVEARMGEPPGWRGCGADLEQLEKAIAFVAVEDTAADEWQAEQLVVDADARHEVPAPVPGNEAFESVNDAAALHPVLTEQWRGMREVACLFIPEAVAGAGIG